MSWPEVLRRHLLCFCTHGFSSLPAECQGKEGPLSFTTSHPQLAPPAYWKSRYGTTRHILACFLTQHLLYFVIIACHPIACLLQDLVDQFASRASVQILSSHSHSRSHNLQSSAQSDCTLLLGLEAIEAQDLQTLARHSRYFWVKHFSDNPSLIPTSNCQSPRTRQAPPSSGHCRYTTNLVRLQRSGSAV